MIDYANAVLRGDEREKLIASLVAYGQTDLLCYFADDERLQQRQREWWEPVLEWAEARYGLPLQRTVGMMPVAQDAQWNAVVRARLEAMDDATLTAMTTLVKVSGSIFLSIALLEKNITIEEFIAYSQLDESWQAEQWGEDDAMKAARADKAQQLRDAYGFILALGD